MIGRTSRIVEAMWSRRNFLTTMLATGALAACGGTGSDGEGNGDGATQTDGSAASTPIPGSTGRYTIVQRFPQAVQVPGPLRLPISLSTGAAALIQDGPLTLGAQVVDADGRLVGGRLEARRRDVEPAPYYDFRPVIDTVGFYALVVDGGPAEGASFDVAEPSTVEVTGAGQPLPPFDTPTFAEPAGVDPICTREPEPCPFHEVTLTEALAMGKPVAYVVGTPAFCQTGSCAPALKSLIEVQAEFGDSFTFVHAEVYTDMTATTLTPAVDASGLSYEPALFITDSSGVVVERLDAVWNTEELVERLEAALS